MKSYLLAALVICAALMWGGWQKIQRQGLAIDQAAQQIDTLERAAESRRNTQRLLLELDTQHTKELTDARKENDQLRADVATGKRRLSVAARCPAVRTGAATAGVDAGEEIAELDPAAAERIVRIANDGDDAIRQLNALQDYVGAICRPATAR